MAAAWATRLRRLFHCLLTVESEQRNTRAVQRCARLLQLRWRLMDGGRPKFYRVKEQDDNHTDKSSCYAREEVLSHSDGKVSVAYGKVTEVQVAACGKRQPLRYILHPTSRTGLLTGHGPMPKIRMRQRYKRCSELKCSQSSTAEWHCQPTDRLIKPQITTSNKARSK